MTINPEQLEESLRRLRPQHDAEALGGPVAQLRRVVDAADDILDVDSVGVLLLDESGALRAVAASGPAAALTETAQERLGVGPGVDSVSAQRTIVSTDLRADGEYAMLPELLGDDVVRALISAPIGVGGQVVGNLNAVARAPRDWTDAEVRAVEAFAGVVSTILQLSASRAAGDGAVDGAAAGAVDGEGR